MFVSIDAIIYGGGVKLKLTEPTENEQEVIDRVVVVV